MMGNCLSSTSEEAEKKKKSQAIDRIIEEDSKRLKKECKILLLGACSLPVAVPNACRRNRDSWPRDPPNTDNTRLL